jgi:hypothetical protein
VAPNTLERLTELERDLVRCYYGLGDAHTWCQKELSQRYGMPVARIGRVESKMTSGTRPPLFQRRVTGQAAPSSALRPVADTIPGGGGLAARTHVLGTTSQIPTIDGARPEVGSLFADLGGRLLPNKAGSRPRRKVDGLTVTRRPTLSANVLQIFQNKCCADIPEQTYVTGRGMRIPRSRFTGFRQTSSAQDRVRSVSWQGRQTESWPVRPAGSRM